jgi:hypothetical protein
MKKWLENMNIVEQRWHSVYLNAGQGKWISSRALCWNNGFCENTNRDNDPLMNAKI